MFTKGLPLGKRLIYCRHFSADTMSRFFPAWQWEDFLNYNRGVSFRFFGFFFLFFLFFLDDIKVFEPSKEVDSTVEMTVRCYRWCKRTKLHIEFPVWFRHYSRQKITENPTPRAVYLKMTRGVDWHLKNQNKRQTGRERNWTEMPAAKKERKKKKKGQERSWTQKPAAKL